MSQASALRKNADKSQLRGPASWAAGSCDKCVSGGALRRLLLGDGKATPPLTPGERAAGLPGPGHCVELTVHSQIKMGGGLRLCGRRALCGAYGMGVGWGGVGDGVGRTIQLHRPGGKGDSSLPPPGAWSTAVARP